MSAGTGAGRSLDALNFFLADVRDGLGPYLAIYLLTVRQWNEADIGLVMTVGGIAAVLAQTPAGALIDVSRHKRAIIIIAAGLITFASIAIPWLSSFSAIALSQVVSGLSGSVFQPAIAAITLGLLGPRRFTRQIGRNEAFNHAGNATAAILAGALGYVYGPAVVFYLMAAMAICSIVAALRIPANRIDHELARGLNEGPVRLPDAENPARSGVDKAGRVGAGVSPWWEVLRSRTLLLFASVVVLFHFANAAMLPLVGQKLALSAPELGTTLMSVCIIAAQLIMIPVAMFVGSHADRWGRKPIFLAGLVVLAIRGALYTVSDNPWWLVGVQCLDGIGAGIFGALFPVIVNDLTRGTGRFNASQGVITTAMSIGAALSTAVAGQIIVWRGYSATFLFLGAVAAVAALLFVVAMPETRPSSLG